VSKAAYDQVRSRADSGVPSDLENCSDMEPFEYAYCSCRLSVLISIEICLSAFAYRNAHVAVSICFDCTNDRRICSAA
jgi:hypothetical protein